MKLPKGWESKKVGDLFDVQLGKMLNETARTKGEQYPYLTNYNVQWGRFDLSKRNEMHFSERDKSKFALKKGDLVVCEGGEVGRCAIWRGEVTPCFFQKTLHRLRPINGEIIPQFMFSYMRFISDSKRVSDLTTQSSIAHLTREQFCKLDVIFPPLSEQRKIAEILSTWDDALEKLDALIAVKERRKKGLMQQLLTGESRLSGAKDKKRTLKASEMFANRSERNADGLPALSVTQDQGVLLRSDLDRRIQHDANNIPTYKVAREGDFIISLRSFEGGLEYTAITGAVSPAYHIIYPIIEMDRSFYRHYFKSPDFIGRLATSVIGIRDGKQVSLEDFRFIRLPYPALKTQKEAGKVLDVCDEEMRLLCAQRAAIDQQKRGLMQKLLTGKARVNIYGGNQ
jgi:type I restriction enzyme S subunit